MIAVPVELSQPGLLQRAIKVSCSGRNNHLSNAIKVLTGDGEGFVNAVDGPGMGDNGREPFGMLSEQVQCVVGFVVGTADVVDCKFFAPHRGAVQ